MHSVVTRKLWCACFTELVPFSQMILAILLIVLPHLVNAQETIVKLEGDFWNFVYVVDAEVLEINSPWVVVEVNRSWNENALPGDTLTLIAITSVTISGRDTLPRKPPRLPLHTGDDYLFFFSGSRIAAFGVGGNGFYRIRGCGASDVGDWYGYNFQPEYITVSELDSLAVHIGNNPHFESREYRRFVAFPSGERISFDELYDSYGFESPESIELPRCISVVDSCVGNCFYSSLIPQSSVLYASLMPQWMLGSDMSIPLSILRSDIVDPLSNTFTAPRITIVDNTRIELFLGSTVMASSYALPRIPYEEGTIELVLAEANSSGSLTRAQERIMLRFPDLERLPAVPDVFVVESALCGQEHVFVEVLHADSSEGKYTPFMTCTIEIVDSLRVGL